MSGPEEGGDNEKACKWCGWLFNVRSRKSFLRYHAHFLVDTVRLNIVVYGLAKL